MVDYKELEQFVIEEYSDDEEVTEKKEQLTTDRIKDWCTVYRRNLDLFNRDYLDIKNLAPFQNIMINSIADNDICVDICSRGISKSFSTALVALDLSLLYSNNKILVVAKNLTQANILVDEKINKIFCSKNSPWSSPVLVKLREEGWITFAVDKETGGKIVRFGNGSEILCAPCIESLRGKRSCVLIADEFVLIKKTDYDEIASPTLEPRKFKGRPLDYSEETKKIFLSSAKQKTNWGWTLLKNCVNDHYKDKRIKNGFYAGDIFTAVASGIQSVNQYIERKRNTEELSFLQEYLNIWLGNGESALLKLEEFERNQVIEHPFYPRNPIDIRSGVEQTWKFRNDEVRFMAVDIAVSVGSNEDNTAILLGSINKTNGLRKIYYVDSINGMNSMEQATLFKRLYYEWKSEYFVFDTSGVGNAIFDILTQPTYDASVDTTYPAWTVNKDSLLQIVSTSVQNDKIQRTISDDAEEIIVPIVGTASLNTEMHLALRKNLREDKLKFLIDDSDALSKFEDDDKLWITRDSDYKAEKILPFLKTRFLINESVSVDAEIKDNGNIKAVEKTSGSVTTKDLFMALDYFNYFSNKLEIKYLKDDDSDDGDFDISQWAFLGAMCAV